MAAKSANVMVRVEPEVKAEAEAVMEQLGLPVSVVINSLYRQIIMTKSIPFSLSLPARDNMSAAEFDSIMGKGLAQAKAGRGVGLDEAFAKVSESI